MRKDEEIWRAIPSTLDIKTGLCRWYTVRYGDHQTYYYAYQDLPLEIFGVRYRAMQVLKREGASGRLPEVGEEGLPRPTSAPMAAHSSIALTA